MSLSRFAVHSPVKVTMIFFAVLLLGWISLTRLPTNLFPDIQAPKITVTVTTKGLSPTEVERRICEVLERSLYSVRGVSSVKSIARADSAVIVTNFEWNTRLEFAFLEVKKAASDLQRERTQDVQTINVLRYDPNATPVVTAALVAPETADMESVLRTADQNLKPRFERLDGVANVVLTGGIKREILINLDEALLLAYDLQVSSVVSALQADNVNASGGWVEEGARRFLLRSVGEFETIEQIRNVVVGRKGDAAILLSNVADIRLAPKESKSIVYLDEKPAVGMAFYREAESNTVAVAKTIRKELEESEKVLPRGWKLIVANDQSLFVSAAITEVRNNAIAGGALAVLVLLLFLRDFRTTMIISVAIPISIIATFNLMFLQGLSLNLMSLGGLALGVGMLVDNAIVVLENIFRLRHSGMNGREAALNGAQQVSGALIASTLTTVAVFLPITFTQGVAALIFKEQALTVSYSLLASLLVALLLIPMLSAYFLGKPPAHFHLGAEAVRVVPRNAYTRALSMALRWRFVVLLGAAGLLVLSVLATKRIPQEFLPDTRTRQVGIRIILPNGTPIEATDRIVDTISAQLKRYEPALERVYTGIGEAEGVVNADTEDPDGPNTADLYVTLRSDDKPTTAMIEAGLGRFNSADLVRGMKPILESIPDVKAEFRTSGGSVAELLGTSAAPLLIEVSGSEIDVLSRMSSEMKDRLEKVPELLNVRTNILEGAPEVLLHFDKQQLARLGLEVNGVAQLLRQRIDGEVATQIKRESGDVDLRVQVDYGEESLETLGNITFKSGTGALVRLASIATFEIVRAPREIVRKRQERVAYVMADLADGVKLSQGIAKAQAALATMTIPPRYGMTFTGAEQQRRESFGNLVFALVLSICLVYMVMASIFESFVQPFLILFTIPLAGVGVIASLIATNQSLNVMSIIGIVMLGGIVVNNAIVLLDCVNQVRGEPGLNDVDSLLIGCNQRLRPVFMTTGTTLLGLLPMALGFGEGAELRQAMAITVLGGLLSSTVLTLFVIPCGQSCIDSVRHLLPRAFRPEPAQGVVAPELPRRS